MRDMSKTAPYARGNEASRQAADKIQHQLEGFRAKVFEFIVSCGAEGAISEEIYLTLGLHSYTAKPRCTELKDAGYIADSGKTRRNKAGNPETVWVALPEWPTGPWKSPYRNEPAAETEETALEMFEDVLRRSPHIKNAFHAHQLAAIMAALSREARDDE